MLWGWRLTRDVATELCAREDVGCTGRARANDATCQPIVFEAYRIDRHDALSISPCRAKPINQEQNLT